MKKVILLILIITLFPTLVFAQNIGNCGWGSKLFDGERGIAPQVLAATTNGTSGNQTFAISSGTSGCTQNGVVKSSWKTAAYIDSNMNKLARDMSRGHGESMDSLAHLLEVKEEDQKIFAKALKDNFDNIFSSVEVSSMEVMASIKDVLSSHAGLAEYSVNI